jgi:dihydrolipoamide dehydrogenase
LDSPRLLDSTSALEIEDIPKNLLVIGGGYIGLEMATVYARLGSQVTVVEMTEGLLPGVDRDLVSVLAKRMEEILHTILLRTRVTYMKEEAKGIWVRFEGDGEGEQIFEKVLVAVGRKPNSAIPGLEHTLVEVNERGFIQVDSQRRTADPAIFAIGDVVGEPMLAHKASHEGRVAAEVIAGRRVLFEPQAIPAVVFTDPEVAWCGLTEVEAKREGRSIQVARFPWAASGRAVTLHRTDGMTKLIIDPETERILGAGIVGSGAGELIAELVLAVEMAAVVSDIKLSIHPHPTLSETVMEAAEVFFGQSTHLYRPAKKGD